MSPAEIQLLAVTLASGSCWLCHVLCQPRSVPLIPPDTAQRYLWTPGRQQGLTALATLLTIAAGLLLLTLPTHIDPDLHDLRLAAASCGQRSTPYDPPTCYALAPGGIWVVEDLHPDGTRTLVGTVAHPAFSSCSPLGKDVYVVEEPSAVSLSFRCP